MSDHNDNPYHIEIKTETLTAERRSLGNWFVLGVETDGQNMAHYASPHHAQPFQWFVFLNQERIAGPFADVGNFKLQNGVLAYTSGQQGQMYVHRNGEQIAGPFHYVPTLHLRDGKIIFAAQQYDKEGPWILYKDGTVVGGPFQDVKAYEIRIQDGQPLYLAQDHEGWWLHKRGQQLIGPFDGAHGLQTKKGHVHFIARRGNSQWIILDGEVIHQHYDLELYSNQLEGEALVYLGCNEQHQVFRFCNGCQVDGPFHNTIAPTTIASGKYYGLLRKKVGQYYLYRDQEQIAGPFNWATELQVTNNTAYYLAKSGSQTYDPLQLMRDNQQLGKVGAEHVHLQLLTGIPVVTYSVGTSTVINVAGQRVDHYDQVSNLFVEDGSIAFYATTTYDLVKVRVTVTGAAQNAA